LIKLNFMVGRPKSKLDFPGVFRMRDVEALGLSRAHLKHMLESGEAERVSWGLYRLADAVTENDTIAIVAKRVPEGIVCLLSALQLHDIGTQLPRKVWLAIDQKAKAPRMDDLPVRLVRFSGGMLRYGVETRMIQDVPVKITNPARTVVDCFRMRSKVGMEVALEALRETLREKKAHPDAILRAAEACRARTIIEPYVEAMLA
jgi:predicted transcriptional regulator of viral defense system